MEDGRKVRSLKTVTAVNDRILVLGGWCFPASREWCHRGSCFFGQPLRSAQEPAAPIRCCHCCWPLPLLLLVLLLTLSSLLLPPDMPSETGSRKRVPSLSSIEVSHQCFSISRNDQKSAGESIWEMQFLVLQPPYFIYQSTKLVTKIIQNWNGSLEYFPLSSGTRQRCKVS